MKVNKTARASFARPANATQYAANDLVANHATAGSVVAAALDVAGVPGGRGKVTRAHIYKSNPSLTAASFRVHFFALAPTVANGDNGAFSASGVAARHLGSVDITVDKAHSDGASGLADCAIPYDCDPGVTKIYALVEVLGTYTPLSGETITVSADVERTVV